jgi:hypothetical protein
MLRRVGRQFKRVWKWARLGHNWLYLLFMVIIVVPLLTMAVSLALRAGMVSGVPRSNAPSSGQIELYLTFVTGGLASAATLLAALFTRDHNMRERRRLRLETVLKSLDALPAQTLPRIAGVLSAMVLLGHQRVAVRVLEPLWERGEVDPGTATWLVGQVLAGDRTYDDANDADRVDEAAINEAAALLASHVDQLTDKRMYYFPGHFLRQWLTDKELPYSAKDDLLLTMGKMLVSQGKDWWSPHGDLPLWPTIVLVECAEHDRVRSIRSAAAVLLAALYDRFREQFEELLAPRQLKRILKRAAQATAAHAVASEYLAVADTIRNHWEPPH